MFFPTSVRWLLLSAFAFSATAAAEDFSYSFVQGSYGQFDLDDFDADGDTFGIGASFAVSNSFHVFGSYASTDYDLGLDGTDMRVGVGFNAPVSDRIDLVASVAYVAAEIDVPSFGSVDEDGYGLGLGLRAMATPALELQGGIDYVDLGGASDGDTSFGAGFLYHFTDMFAAGASGQWSDDASAYMLSGRFFFGN